MSEETRQDGSQYIDGVFVAMATLGKEIAALQNEVARLTESCELANRMWKQQNAFAQSQRDASDKWRDEYEQMNVNTAWGILQAKLAGYGEVTIWRAERGGKLMWYVSSKTFADTGTGETLMAAFNDVLPEVPA